jgi:hypothetical protein
MNDIARATCKFNPLLLAKAGNRVVAGITEERALVDID